MHPDEPDNDLPERISRAAIADAEPLLARQLVNELARRSIDPAGLLRGLGIGLADLESPDVRISYLQTGRMVRRALNALAQPHLGLALGASASLASWGPCLVGMLACADSHEMLELATDYLPSTDCFLALRTENGTDGFAIVAEPRFAEPDPEVAAFLVEGTFALLARAAQFIVGPSFVPKSVSLQSAAVSGEAPAADVLGCRLQFGQHANRLVFPGRAEPIDSADPLLARLCRRALALHGHGEHTASELEEAIVGAFRADLRSPPSVQALAASVNLSERTLRRRLRRAGLSYAALLDNERMQRAVGLLGEPDRPLAEVAEQAGFTDTRSLRRAIRRWTGRTPTQVRRGDAPSRTGQPGDATP